MPSPERALKMAPWLRRPATRPRSALKPRGDNGNAPQSSGRGEAGGIRWKEGEKIQQVLDIEATGNMNPTPPRSRGARNKGLQQSELQAIMQDPEMQALMSQPGVVGPLQEILTNPQQALPRYAYHPPSHAALAVARQD